MALTDAKIKSAKLPEDKKQLKLSDGESLYLLLKGKGKYWRFDYTFLGKQKTLALGVYPTVSLKEAREKRFHAKKLIESNIEPNQHKKEQRQNAKKKLLQVQKSEEENQNTFQILARKWLAIRKNEWSISNYDKNYGQLKNHAFPEIGSIPITKLTKAQVSSTLDKIAKRGLIDTAHRVARLIRNILEYACDIGLIELIPMGSTKTFLTTNKSKPLPSVIDTSEIGQLLLDIDGYKGYYLTQKALSLLPYLAVRSEEFREAEWTEFDLGQGLWTIPAAHRKLKKEMKSDPNNWHLVPLSRQAIKILNDIKELSISNSRVLPSIRNPNNSMSENTINKALKKLGYKNKMVGHGFRTMFSTIMNTQGYNPDAIERQLAHKERNAIRAAYNRSDYMDERIKIMQDWADHLDKFKKNKALQNLLSDS